MNQKARENVARLRGVFGFPVTPFKPDLSLDLEALERNVSEMASYPFCALVAAGGTGELYSLTPDEAEAVVRSSVKAAQGRMPVVAGTGFNALTGVEMARRATAAGAEMILALPPYYINSPEEGLFAYYQAIGEATDLPLMVYSRDWAVFSPDMVNRLAQRVPTLVAWKDGQGNIRNYQRVMETVGERLAWFGGLGDDCVPGYFAIGVQAYTSSISNVAPKLSLALAEAGISQDFVKLSHLMKRYVNPFYALRERMRGYEVSTVKEGMEMLGMTAGPVRPPLVPCRAKDREDLRSIMQLYKEMR